MMKFLKDFYNALINKAKAKYQTFKQSVSEIRKATLQLKELTWPHLKTLAEEKVSLPFGISIKKGIVFVIPYVGIHAIEFAINYYVSILATNANNASTETLQTAEISPQSNVTEMQTTIRQLLIAGGNIILTTSLLAGRKILSSLLKHSIEKRLKHQLARAWLNDNAATGVSYLQTIKDNEARELAVTEVFSTHIAWSAKGVSLILDMVSNTVSAFTQLYFIKRLFNNPKFLSSLVIYGLTIVGLRRILFYNAYKNLHSDISNESSKINSRIVNIQQFGLQILSVRGAEQELLKLLPLFEAREGAYQRMVWLEAKESSTFHLLHYITDPLLDIAFPEVARFYYYNQTGRYFYRQTFNIFIEQVRNLSNHATQDLSTLAVSVEQVSRFKGLLQQWKQFNRLQLMKREYHETASKAKKNQCLSLHQFKIHIFDGNKKEKLEHAKQILKKPNLLAGPNAGGVMAEFKKGCVYLFPDLSGTGKTTILKTIIGLYPLASGRLQFPCRIDEVFFLSRNSFIPIQSTLLEAIIAPNTPDKESEKLVRDYIDKVEFLDPEKHKKSLLEVSDWSKKLSDGEKQRFAIIGVLIRKPKVLILDEALGNLDKPSKSLLEHLIKKELVDTKTSIVLYADHHPAPGFADVVVKIQNRNLVFIPESGYDYPYLRFDVSIDSKNKIAL